MITVSVKTFGELFKTAEELYSKECDDESNPSILLKNAIINTMGKAAWEELRGVSVHVPVNEKEDAPAKAYQAIRSLMFKAGLLDVRGFEAKFPKIALFDELTHQKRKNQKIVNVANKMIKENPNPVIRIGSYEVDGADYSGEMISDIKLSDSYPFRDFAGRYVPRPREEGYCYYYRNELDHLFSHLTLLCCLTATEEYSEWNAHDLGLIAMKEAVCGDAIEPADWEQGITNETLLRMDCLIRV